MFVLKFIQARNPAWVGKTFFAKYDTAATWLDDLTPALGEERFFFDSGGRPGPAGYRDPGRAPSPNRSLQSSARVRPIPWPY